MNDRVLEVDDTALVDADDWARFEPKPAPLSASDELQRQVDEYLANGGEIKEFEPGESAIPTNQFLWSFPVGKAAQPDPVLRKKHDDLRLAQVKQRIAGDAKAVAALNLALGHCTSLTQLCQEVGFSTEKVFRVIRDHFPDDKRADRFRKRTREQGIQQREEELLAKVKEAQAAGIRGVWNITKYCESAHDAVSKLDKKYKLGITLSKGDNRAGRVQTPKRVYKGNAECESCHARMVVTCHFCPQCGTITARGLAKESEE